MDSEEFRKRAREVIKYVVDYHANIRERRIYHGKEHGYLKNLLPDSAPEKSENFGRILEDVENCIMPGIIHWRSPRYFAYFPCGVSYPSILADMLVATVNCVGFSWAAAPACMELEIITLNWLGKMVGLPEEYLALSDESAGGGVFQVSSTDAMLVTVIAARHAKTKEEKQQKPMTDQKAHLSNLVAYCADISHPTIMKIAEVALIQVHPLATDDKNRLRGETLDRAMEEDQQKGLVPFFVFASLGTTACCSCDILDEIGPVCKKYKAWFHVDAAYAGSALICPEFQHFLTGIDFADSFSLDPSMWMLINFDCCALWVKDRYKLTEALVIDPLYLQHAFSDKVIDYRHWGVPLSRRFRALKLWFVVRSYGVEGLQANIRKHVRLAKMFENFILGDDKFVLENEVHFGLVCFRLKGCNTLNMKLLAKINTSGEIFLVGTMLKTIYIIRFCICSEYTKEEDVTFAWETINKITLDLLEEEKIDHTCSENDKKCLEMMNKLK